MTRRALSVSVVALSISLSQLAFGQGAEEEGGWETGEGAPAEAAPESAPAETKAAPAAEPATTPATMNVETPPPAPAVERSYHVHDGFYFRANIGLGAYGVRYDDDVNAGGASLAFDLMIGGSPGKGFVVGGALLSDFNRNLTLRQDDRDLGAEVAVATGLVGPFVDGFPNPKGGWHLGGMIGLATIRTEDFPENGKARTDSGVGGAVFGGYDAWVGDEFAVGGLLRFSAAVGRSEADDGRKLDSTSTALTLMFTALYH
jgi:hypothetical protein